MLHGFFFFNDGIKLWKIYSFNIYLNIRRMECIKNKNNNTFILQMHVNSALASIQIPPGTQVRKQMGNQLVGFKTLLG